MKAVTYIAVILVCRVVQSIFGKFASKRIIGIKAFFKYSLILYALCAATAFFVLLPTLSDVKLTPLSVIIPVASGAFLFLSTFTGTYGLKYCSMSVMSMFSTSGLLVPLLAGIFLFSQPVGIVQWIGVAGFFFAVYLLVSRPDKTKKKLGAKSIIFLAVNLVANGLTMLTQQLYTHCLPQGNISLFTFLSFLTVTIAMIPLSAFTKAKPDENNGKIDRNVIISAVLLAVALFFINQFATACTALVSPVILFTLINGGATVITTVVGALVYKEKLTVKTTLGIIIGIAAMITIKLFA